MVGRKTPHWVDIKLLYTIRGIKVQMTKITKSIVFVLVFSTLWLLYDKFVTNNPNQVNQLPEWVSPTEKESLLYATQKFFNERNTKLIGKYLNTQGKNG